MFGILGLLLGTERLLKRSESSVFATVCGYDFHLEEQSVMHALCLFCSRVSFL